MEKTFHLTPLEMAEIQKPVKGPSDRQSLMAALQAKLNAATGEITPPDAEIGRIMRYSAYGSGGFQGRFRLAFKRAFREAKE